MNMNMNMNMSDNDGKEITYVYDVTVCWPTAKSQNLKISKSQRSYCILYMARHFLDMALLPYVGLLLFMSYMLCFTSYKK